MVDAFERLAYRPSPRPSLQGEREPCPLADVVQKPKSLAGLVIVFAVLAAGSGASPLGEAGAQRRVRGENIER